jgi:hypothetical protein
VRCALALLALAGCDKLLGLDDIKGKPRTQQITGSYHWMSAPLGSDELPVPTDDPAPLDATTLTATLLDGTPVAVDRTDDGTFTFAVPPGALYRLAVMDADTPFATEFETDTTAAALVRRNFNRLDASPASMPTPVTFHVTVADPLLGFARIGSIGIRTYLAPDNPDIENPTLDWSHTNDGLLSAARNDRLLYQHWQVVGTNTYSTITEADEEAVEMMDGVPTVIPSTGTKALPPLLADRCVHLVSKRLTELSRLEKLTGLPGKATWGVFSGPPVGGNPGALFQLALSTDAATPVDDDLEIDYASPYHGELDVIFVQDIVSRPFQLPNTQAVGLAEAQNLFALVTPTSSPCPDNITSVGETPQAIAASVTLAGQLLMSDAQVVMLERSSPIPLEYTLTDGVYDYITVTVVELFPSAGVTQSRPVRTYVGASPLAVDPALFVKDHYYTLLVTVTRGYPQASMLDYRTHAFPSGTTTIYSPMFRVGS